MARSTAPAPAKPKPKKASKAKGATKNVARQVKPKATAKRGKC